MERIDDNGVGVAGIVPESPRSPAETSSSDATPNPEVAREEPIKSGMAGLSADDPDAGEERKKAYQRGAILVSRID